MPWAPTATKSDFAADQVTAFSGLLIVKEPLETTVPPGVVIVNGPLKLPINGIVTMICVLLEVAIKVLTPLITTVTCEAVVGKPAPVIVTFVPAAPLVGVNPETVGAEGGLPPPPVGD